MEKRATKILVIGLIFFIGLSLGSINLNTRDFQDDLDDFENDITNPDSDMFNELVNTSIDKNILNIIAKDGENVLSDVFKFLLSGFGKLF